MKANNTIKKEVLDLLVGELKSGKYEKAEVMLRKKNKFCVYGILCELHRVYSGEVGEWIEASDGKEYYVTQNERCHDSLPASVKKWAGIEEIFTVLYQGKQVGLMYLNDVVGLSFPEIGEIVEKFT